VFDPHLVDYCRENNIHLQAYNIMNGILGQEEAAPNAYESLREIATSLSNKKSWTRSSGSFSACVGVVDPTEQFP
jgi:hypothetical protein